VHTGYAMKSTFASKSSHACCRSRDTLHACFGPKFTHTTSRRPKKNNQRNSSAKKNLRVRREAVTGERLGIC
jgi:hypothetical protein